MLKLFLSALISTAAIAAEPNYTQTLEPIGRALYAQTGSKDFVEQAYKATPKYVQYPITAGITGYQVFKRKQIQYKYRWNESYRSRINVSRQEAYFALEYSIW